MTYVTYNVDTKSQNSSAVELRPCKTSVDFLASGRPKNVSYSLCTLARGRGFEPHLGLYGLVAQSVERVFPSIRSGDPRYLARVV